MGHVFDFNEAVAYEKWMKKPENELAFQMEIQLLRDMLSPGPESRFSTSDAAPGSA